MGQDTEEKMNNEKKKLTDNVLRVRGHRRNLKLFWHGDDKTSLKEKAKDRLLAIQDYPKILYRN